MPSAQGPRHTDIITENSQDIDFPPKITCVRNFRNSLFQKRSVFDFLGCFENYFRR